LLAVVSEEGNLFVPLPHSDAAICLTAKTLHQRNITQKMIDIFREWRRRWWIAAKCRKPWYSRSAIWNSARKDLEAA
jgi:hypothetical protein